MEIGSLMEIGALLREKGHRLTEPRRLVWAVLAASDRHLTANEIAARVNGVDPSVNVSSVYRTLSLFGSLDLIRESNLGVDGSSRWELAHPDEHFHLVCEECGDVEHHAGEIVTRARAHLSGEHGFYARSIELVARGTCADCG